VEDGVGPVAGRAKRQEDAAARRTQPLADFDQASHAVFVVGVIDDDHAAIDLEEVGPPGIAFRVQHEGAKPLDDGLLRKAGPERGGRRGHGVAHVIAGDPGQGDRHLLDRQQPVRVAARRHHHQSTVENRDRAPALGEGRADRRVVGVE